MQMIEKRIENGKADPTANVREMLGEAIHRQDDLREAEARLVSNELEAERRRVNEQLSLRADYSRQLDEAESKRIDAIRAVDVAAVAVASERATQSASVLATQVAASAETLRTLVASTAVTIAQQLAQLSNQLSDRISTLEKSSYEGIGKGRVADPMMADLIVEMKEMIKAQDRGSGKSEGGKAMWGYVAAGFGFLFLLMGMAGMIYAFSKVAG